MKLEPLESSNYYHFYNRGNNKENIFIEDENYLYFLKLIKKYLLPIAGVYSYCLLPNHFHLLLKIKEKSDLPVDFKNGKKKLHQAFSNLFNAYTKAFNKKYARTGSLFQKHPKRIKLESEEYLQNLIIYINTNSSHHNIGNYITYKFSSYQALISTKHTSLKRTEIIKLFDDVENFKYVHQIKKVNLKLIHELIVDD